MTIESEDFTITFYQGQLGELTGECDATGTGASKEDREKDALEQWRKLNPTMRFKSMKSKRL